MTAVIRLGMVALLALAVRPELVPGPSASLGVQACNTDCQTAFTDCIQRCDGAAPCMAACDVEVAACVKRCVSPAPSSPAPTGSSAARPRAPPEKPKTPPKAGAKP